MEPSTPPEGSARTRASGTGPVVLVVGRRPDPPDAATPRFPPQREAAVAEALRSRLAALAPRVLVSSAACGADLLAQEAAEVLGIPTRVVLPYEVRRFRETSVTDRPGAWGPRFDRVVERARTRGELVVLGGADEGEEAYRAATTRMLEEAAALARSGDGTRAGVTTIVAWNGSSRGPDDLTAAARTAALERGWTVLEVRTDG